MAMNIGGLQPVTASDFPGKMASIVFTQGCNFRCPFCHNAALLPMQTASPVPVENIFTYLEKRRNLLTGVVISGGEPCLQRDLPRFCGQIKAMGFAVKLDTNGSRPDMIESLLTDRLVDYIAMDIKAPDEKIHLLAGVPAKVPEMLRSITLIAESGIPHLFRTTDVAQLLSSRDHVAIRKMVPTGSWHLFQPFVPQNALAKSLRQNSSGYQVDYRIAP